MPSFEIPKTAEESGLMQGFPPSADKLVTHTNQFLGPYNRWSFQNELALNPTVDVWRGPGPAAPLERNLIDLSHGTYKNRAGTQFSFDDMVEMSYSDGILVLHHGQVIYERYLNGMQPHSLHCWAFGSKSVTGTLAAALASEGLFDPGEVISTYLPELKDSGFGDATLRQVMDMTTQVGFAKEQPNQVTENYDYGIAMGWLERPAGYSGSANAYQHLPTMQKTGPHGFKFTYLTPNMDVLAWLIKRRLNQYQWWITHNAHRAYLSLGYGGQMLYIDPAAQMVIAKFSSYPTPTPAGNEFYSMFAAFPALARKLEEKA
jgi:CubicO group peptidase (beta-lactamase class C family)